MQQHDEVVSGWLNGSESVEGLGNPAGPLFLANADILMANVSIIGETRGTTGSCRGSCQCC